MINNQLQIGHERKP